MLPFVSALALTVIALLAVVWTGHTRRRNAHYATIVAMLGLLLWAIYEAETYGAGLVFEGAAATVRTVHFVFVTGVFLCLPVTVWSGLKLARDERQRPLHRKVAVTFVVLAVLACGLGTAMTMMAEPAA